MEAAEQAKIDMIVQLDAAREQVSVLAASLSPETEVYPGWTLHELLAHFAGWDEAVTSSLRAHTGGDELAAVAVRGIDYYNAESVASRETLSYEQVVKEWALARDELKAAIHALPAAKIQQPVIFPWGGSGSAAALVRSLAGHELAHVKEIHKQLAQHPLESGQ